MNLCVTLPQFDGFIVFKSCRCDDVFGGMTGGAENDVRVSLETLYNFFALEIPNVD